MIHIANLSIREFENLLDGDVRVVSFGAGRALHALCKKYAKLANCIVYVADSKKRGSLCLSGRTIPIRPMDQCEKNGEILYLISSLQYGMEIIKQLDQIDRYDGMKVYVPAVFAEESVADGDDQLLAQAKGEQVIPKTIHYCWFGGTEIPAQFQANIETWKKFCPDYKIIRWDESNYDIGKNLYMKQAYEKKRWGFVPDYARLDIVNTYGGIYLDTDVELLKPLDSLLQFPFFCGFESAAYIALGLGYGSKKDNKLLRDMMSVYDQVEFINADGTLNITPSPAYQTQVLTAYGLKRTGQTQITKDFLALSAEYLSPINFLGIGQPTDRSISIHQYAATWFDSNQRATRVKNTESNAYILERLRQNA